MLARRGCAAMVLLIVAIWLGMNAAGYPPDALFSAPWAYSRHGRPYLTRTWVGSFVTPAGRSGALLLDLHRSRIYRGGSVSRVNGWASIEGIARTCGLNTWPAEDIAGSANRSGSRLSIGFAGPRYAPRGWYFDVATGSWSGDTLRVAATLEQRAGPTSTTGGSDPDTRDSTRIVLTPGTESDYDAQCHTLPAS